MKKLLFISMLCWLSFAGTEPAQLVVHLLNYIASDYSGAVSSSGTVVSEFEYQEQMEFVQRLVEESQRNTQLGEPEFQNQLRRLQEGIENKQPPDQIQSQAAQLSQWVIARTGISTEPKHQIDLVSGKNLYGQNCSQCHGVTGLGDGPSSGNFNPPPTQFTNPKLSQTSLFQLFNTIQLGVPGTAMAAFDHLAPEEIWDIVFYVARLRRGITTSEVSNSQVFLMKAVKAVEESALAYQKKQFLQAKNLAITAYLEGVEPLEPKLRLKNAEFQIQLEKHLTDLRHLIEQQAPVEQVLQKAQESSHLLEQADLYLVENPPDTWFIFSVAFGIFLREAFEAALILITLIGVVRNFGSKKAVWAVHAGWGSALLLGIGAWFFSGVLLRMTGAQRELIEGGVALFAVLVLLYFGLWMHRKTEIGRWRDFIKQMVGLAKERKNILILGGVAFMGVFRETFETVIFLRALLLETTSQSHQMALALGVVCAFILVASLSWWSVKWSARLPIRNLFQISSGMMFFLSFILIGKGIHALQESGLVPVTAIGIQFQSDLLGVYPFYQTLLAQLGLAVVISLYLVFEKRGLRSTS